MVNQMYCITCEKMDELETEEGHVSVIIDNREIILDWCEGPFSYCHPPLFDNSYWEFVFANEPSIDELEQINQNGC